MLRRALLAPDSFKGTIGADRVTAMLAGPLRERGVEVDPCPLTDGGERSLAVLLDALGGERIAVAAHDALGRPLEAEIGVADGDRVAIVETAAAIGLARIAPADRDPEAATSAGAGELIAAAAARAPWVLVGVGDSATNDGGAGALAAIAAAGAGHARVLCLCDVRTPWELASSTYGPQKGADRDAVARLERRLDRLAAELPRDPRGVPMSGGAGGLAGGLWAGVGARLVPGARFVCGLVGFDSRVRAAAVAITGEGRLDATTLEGKVVSEVAARSRRFGVPVHAVVGADGSDPAVRAELGLASIVEAGDEDEIAAAAAEIPVPDGL